MVHLAGRSAIVTGAAGGIGRTVVRRLASEGATVIAVDCDRAPDGGDRDNSQVHWVEADVTSLDEMRQVTALATGVGPLAACVANAGTLLIEDLLHGTPESWKRVFQVNVIGVMTTFQVAGHAMVAGGAGGRLVATASIAGVRGEAGSSAYSASKAAVINLVQSAALELAGHAITVNAIAPGEVDTPMHRDAMKRIGAARSISPEALRQQLVDAAIPLRRMATPEDVAEVVNFLVSPAAAYLTGLTVRVDGGQLLL